MREWPARKQLIDPAPKAAGFSPIVCDTPSATHDTGAAEGPTDYIPFHCGEGLAAIQAKKLSLGSQNVLVQVQRYSGGPQDGAFNFHGSWPVPEAPTTKSLPLCSITFRPSGGGLPVRMPSIRDAE